MSGEWSLELGLGLGQPCLTPSPTKPNPISNLIITSGINPTPKLSRPVNLFPCRLKNSRTADTNRAEAASTLHGTAR